MVGAHVIARNFGEGGLRMTAAPTFVKFEVIEEKPKTKVYSVTKTHGGDFLGTVKWWGAWRQYCFFPDPDTLYSDGCLQAIVDFIKQLMGERKKKVST